MQTLITILGVSIVIYLLLVKIYAGVVTRKSFALGRLERLKETRALRSTVRIVNEAKSVWVKLARVDEAIEMAQTLRRRWPTNRALTRQISHLKEVRRALCNEALRSRVEKMIALMDDENELVAKLDIGKKIIRFLETAKAAKSADMQLIKHYYETLSEHLSKTKLTSMLDNRLFHNLGVQTSMNELVHSYLKSVSIFLENEVPEAVEFFSRAEIKLSEWEALPSA